MMMLPVIMMVTVALPVVSASFGLEGGLHLYEIRSESKEHILNYMVGPNSKNLTLNFSRQMPIPQMPRKAHKLIGIFMPDFDNRLRCGLNFEPPPILKLQAIPLGHGNRFRKVKQDIFAVIRSQANATAMARVKIEGERASRFFLRPMTGGAMN